MAESVKYSSPYRVMKKTLLVVIGLAFSPQVASAHCPLCTAGAGALAILAASLGVSSIIVGILIGAFSLALGLWLSNMVKKQYLPYQKLLLTAVIFLGTVIPIMPLVQAYGPLYLSLGGEYGTLWHNTYTVNLYLFGVVMGAIIMLIAPLLSRFLTRVRGRQFPYQGLVITFSLLIIVSLIVQFWP